MTSSLVLHLLLVLHVSRRRRRFQEPFSSSSHAPLSLRERAVRTRCCRARVPYVSVRHTSARALLGLLLSASPGSGPSSDFSCQFGGRELHVGELTQDSSCTTGR